MRNLTRLIALTIAISTWTRADASEATAPSFDCSKAEGSIELRICADESLAALDRNLAASFLRVRAASKKNDSYHDLLNSQVAWLKARDRSCGSSPAQSELKPCIEAFYRSRLEALDALQAGYWSVLTEAPERIAKCEKVVQDLMDTGATAPMLEAALLVEECLVREARRIFVAYYSQTPTHAAEMESALKRVHAETAGIFMVTYRLPDTCAPQCGSMWSPLPGHAANQVLRSVIQDVLKRLEFERR